MARKNLSRAASLIDGFNAMYDTIGRVQNDREERRYREELRDIASSQPVTDTGFTTEQGQQLEAAANSGQYNIEYDPASKGYKVISKTDPNAVGAIDPGARTSFQGKSVTGAMDDGQVHKARQLAMAGAMERRGDLDGAAKLRDRLGTEDDRAFNRERSRTTAAREDWRFGQETKKADQEDAYKQGMAELTGKSVFGQRSKAYQEAVAKHEADMTEYRKKLDAGDASAVPPPAPVVPSMTSGERLQDAAVGIEYMARHGKATPEMIDKITGQMVALGQEGYMKMLDMAHGGAPLTAVVSAFNATGKAKLDPAAIIEDRTVERPGGVKSRLITYKLPDGRTETIDTAAELNSLGQADKLLKTAKQAHDMAIQERQVTVSEGNARRLQADFDAGDTERDAKDAVARLRIELASDGITPQRQQEIEAKIRALSTGARGGGAAQADPAKVREAQTVLAAGLAPDMAGALEFVMQNPDKQHQSLVEKALSINPNGKAAVKIADEAMSSMGWERRGNRWTKAAGGAPGGAAAPPQGAIDKLKADPSLAPAFDQKYGPGAAQRAIGGNAPAASAPATVPRGASAPASRSSTGKVMTEADARVAAALTPAEAARSAAYERSPGNMRELELAIAAEKDPAKREILLQEARKQMAAQLAAQGG